MSFPKVRMDMPDSLLDLLPNIVLLPRATTGTSQHAAREQQRDAARQAEARRDRQFLRQLGIRASS